MSYDEPLIQNALSAMKDGRYTAAIPLFEQQMARQPDDLKSLLQLGFCHLLNRSEKLFLRIYKEATTLKHSLGSISDDVRRMFTRYEGWVKKVTATALVLGSMGAAACGQTIYGAPVYDAVGTETSDAILDGGDTADDTNASTAFTNEKPAAER